MTEYIQVGSIVRSKLYLGAIGCVLSVTPGLESNGWASVHWFNYTRNMYNSQYLVYLELL